METGHVTPGTGSGEEDRGSDPQPLGALGTLVSVRETRQKRFKRGSVKGSLLSYLSSVQFSSVAQSCPTLCNPMNCSTPGLPVHHQLPEFTQTHVH